MPPGNRWAVVAYENFGYKLISPIMAAVARASTVPCLGAQFSVARFHSLRPPSLGNRRQTHHQIYCAASASRTIATITSKANCTQRLRNRPLRHVWLHCMFICGFLPATPPGNRRTCPREWDSFYLFDFLGKALSVRRNMASPL